MTIAEYTTVYRRAFKKLGKANPDTMDRRDYMRLFLATKRAVDEIYEKMIGEIKRKVNSLDVEITDEVMQEIQDEYNKKWNAIAGNMNRYAGEKIMAENAFKFERRRK